MKVYDAIRWFKDTFKNELQNATVNSPYTEDLLCAIAYQETGYIWSQLINKVPISDLVKLCVGDTLDAPNRSAFPKTKAALLTATNGQDMFDIARKALVDMSKHITGYNSAVKNKNKFCHGFGIFQYDLQFFKTDPNYFLNKKWENTDACFGRCISELKNAQDRQGWSTKTVLTDTEKVYVAIAYNKGRADLSLGFKQGHKSDDGRYYGENIFDYLRIAQTISLTNPIEPAPLPAPTPVSSSKKIFKVKDTTTSLNLRATPSIPKIKPNSNILAGLPAGHLLSIVSGSISNKWIQVETSINGGHFIGYVSTEYIVAVKDKVIPVSIPNSIIAPNIPAVYMPKATGTIIKRIEYANAHTLNESNQPTRPQSGLPAELSQSLNDIVDWLNVEKVSHKRYQPTSNATFCNIYAHDYCHLAGIYLPRVWWTQSALVKISQGETVKPLYGNTIEEIRANNIFRWLNDFGLEFGWRQTGNLTSLQQVANLGGVAIIIARRKEEGKSGHVAIVIPETSLIKAKRNQLGDVIIPLQSQAGSTNYKRWISSEWWKGNQFAEFAFWIHA